MEFLALPNLLHPPFFPGGFLVEMLPVCYPFNFVTRYMIDNQRENAGTIHFLFNV